MADNPFVDFLETINHGSRPFSSHRVSLHADELKRLIQNRLDEINSVCSPRVQAMRSILHVWGPRYVCDTSSSLSEYYSLRRAVKEELLRKSDVSPDQIQTPEWQQELLDRAWASLKSEHSSLAHQFERAFEKEPRLPSEETYLLLRAIMDYFEQTRCMEPQRISLKDYQWLTARTW